MLKCTPTPIPKEVLDIARQWEQTNDSNLFMLVGKTQLSRSLTDWVYTELKNIDRSKILDVIIDCSGGNIEAAYQLIGLFRNNCTKLRVFVPDWAKSAATFFCLGADEIWMSQMAELGPLDAQISDPRDPDTTISALEEFRAIDYLRTAAFETMDQLVTMLITRTRMRVRDLLSEARQFATELTRPLYAQVDPLLFGAAHRALEMSMEYGQRVMKRYAYKDWKENKIDEIVERLTWTYPSHSFVIDYEEATQLGLKVFLLTGENENNAHILVSKMYECIGFLQSKYKKDESKEENNQETVPMKGDGDERQE